MSEDKPKDDSQQPGFQAEINSDVRKAPVRVAFVTRRTSPQVKTHDEEYVMTYPTGFYHAGIAVGILLLILVWMALLWNAPLEGLADPMHTPNPAKAPWYFLGLQELLHYFPPVVAGVILPGLVVLALIVIPYFDVNVKGESLWAKDRKKRMLICSVVVVLLSIFLAWFDVYAVLLPTIVLGAAMLLAGQSSAMPEGSSRRFRRWLAAKPLSFWIMTWFLVQAVVLTLIGTFFRGPGWSWDWPWRIN